MSKKLNDIYRVRGRFQRSVRIDTDLANENPLDGYSFNDSAWEVLRQVFANLTTTQQRAFTWTGPYGAGKSSLALFLTSLVGADADLRKIATEKIGAKRLGALLKGDSGPKKGWIVVPVVGSQENPVASIREAFRLAVKQKWPARKPNKVNDAVEGKSAKDLIDGLVAAGETASKSGDGLVLILDEMGKSLEGIAEDGGDLQFFQELAEAFAHTDANCLMIGILHQSFQEYAARASQSARNEWAKVQGRFVDIPFSVSLEDVVTLVGDALEGPKPSTAVAKLCARAVSDIDHPRYKGLNRFDRKLANCWPLHPLTALMLGPLSRTRFGQNERSTFSFLSSSEPRGFRAFLLDEEAPDDACYLPHWLWEYLQFNLEPAILASSDGHRWSEAAEAIERANKLKSGLAEPIAKLIGLLNLYGRPFGLVATEKLIRLSFPRQSKRSIDQALRELKTASIAVYRRHLGAWALFAGSDVDLDFEIQLASVRLGTELMALRPYLPSPKPVIAKRHYHETGTLRWFDIRIMAVSEVDADFAALNKDKGQSGSFVLLVPDDTQKDTDISDVCKKYANLAREEGNALAFGAPSNAKRLLNAVHHTATLERVLVTTSELEQDAVAHRELSGRLNVARNSLRDILETTLDEADWHLPLKSKPPKGRNSITRLASDIAGAVYFKAPILHNELVNRDKPSSNAVAARRNLLHLMIGGGDSENLGIEGYPAELGLYKGLLEASGLHQPTKKKGLFWAFGRPGSGTERANSFIELWDDFEEFLTLSEAERQTFGDLYERWRAPPFGLRHGVMPILAIALVMAHQDEIALYADGTFTPAIDDLFVNLLLQSPNEMALQKFRVAGVRQDVLQRFADVVADALTVDKPSSPLATAKPLAKFAFRLPQWVKRTTTLDAETLSIRDVLLSANDPNALLFMDLPRACGLSEDFGEKTRKVLVDEVIKKLRSAITDLGSAYERMLETLADTLSISFGYKTLSQSALDRLAERGDRIAGLSGDFRLDAFARRLGSNDSRTSWLEGLGGLAANKPVRDWADADLERAKVEITGLAKRFQRIERILVTQTSDSRSIHLNGAISHGNSTKEVDIAVSMTKSSSKVAKRLSAAIISVLESSEEDERLKLAALVDVLHSLTKDQEDNSEDVSNSVPSTVETEEVE